MSHSIMSSWILLCRSSCYMFLMLPTCIYSDPFHEVKRKRDRKKEVSCLLCIFFSYFIGITFYLFVELNWINFKPCFLLKTHCFLICHYLVSLSLRLTLLEILHFFSHSFVYFVTWKLWSASSSPVLISVNNRLIYGILP